MTAFEWWRARYQLQGRRCLRVAIYEPRKGSYGGVEEEGLVFFGKEATDWNMYCQGASFRGCEVAVHSKDSPVHHAFVDFRDYTPTVHQRRRILTQMFPELGGWTFFDSGRSYHAVADLGISFDLRTDPMGEAALSKYLTKLANINDLGVDTKWTEACADDGYCLLRLSRNNATKFYKEPEVLT